MIDNGSKTWTVFTTREQGTEVAVIATRWSDTGPGPERTVKWCATQAEADTAARKAQADYDTLRSQLLNNAREANK